MVLGTFLLAVAINLFFRPAAIFAGGIPGLAIIVLNIIGEAHFRYLAVIILAIQVVFIGVQWSFLGKGRTLKAVVTSLLMSAMVQLTIEPLARIQLSDNPLLMALGGSILGGLGVGLVLSSGFSFIGTVGIAEIVSEKLKIPPGKTVLYVEGCVLLAGALVIGFEKAMISAIGLYVLSRTVHALTFGTYPYKKLLIVSPELNPIRMELTRTVSDHSSILVAKNAARGVSQDLLMIVMRYDQYKQARDIIRRHDPRAFVMVSDVTELIGEGFKTL